MRSKNKLIYGLFLAIGVTLLLMAYVLKTLNSQLLGDISKDLGIVVLSLMLVDFLWNIVGGEPLSKEIWELRNLNALNRDAQVCGLTRIYAKAGNIEPATWLELITNTRITIDISALTLYDIVDRTDLWNAMVERINAGVHVRILINSPDNPAWSYGVDYAHPNAETMRQQMAYSWSRLQELHKSLSQPTRSYLNIARLHNETMHLAIRRFDDKMYVVHYTYSARTSDTPVYVIEGANKPLFKTYLYEFEHLHEHNVEKNTEP